MENHPLHYDIDAIGQDIVHFEDFIDSSCDARWYPNHDYHTMYMAEIEKVLVKE